MGYVTKLRVLEGQKPTPKPRPPARRRAEMVDAAVHGIARVLLFAFAVVGFAVALRWLFIVLGAPL
jgi:hypothetical protein